MSTSSKRALLGMVLLLGTALAGPASASWPGDNGRIVAVEPRYDTENCTDTCQFQGSMIVSQATDGGDPLDLAVGENPSWNAGGTRIVFQSPSYAIWRIKANGTGKRRVTTTQAEANEDEFVDTFPGWSPTGNRVVFQRDSQAGNVHRIMIVEVGPSSPLPEPTRVSPGRRPEWSSRGMIAFLRTVDGVSRVYTVRPDGDERAAVPNTRGATDVTWSPSGMRLAFVTPGSGEGQCLHIVRIDGSDRKTLACGFRGAGGGGVAGITWAPNGGSLLVGVKDFFDDPTYSAGRTVKVLLDGAKKRTDVTGYMPDWQPRP